MAKGTAKDTGEAYTYHAGESIDVVHQPTTVGMGRAAQIIPLPGM